MNADERRFYTVTEFEGINHYKVINEPQYNNKCVIEHGFLGLNRCARIKRIRENPSNLCHPCSTSQLMSFSISGRKKRPVWPGVKKILLIIETDPKGGFNARARDYSIFMQGETIEEVRKNIIDVNCHFDNSNDIMAEAILYERR